MDYIVRRATEEDLREIALLDRLCFPDDEPYSAWTPNTEWWIAWTLTGYPVGYAGVQMLHRESSVFLCRAGVLRRHRRRGLARRLTTARLAWARKAGAKVALTYTSTDNVASANNLIAQGFRLYTPAWAWAGRSGVLYWQRAL